MENVFEGSFEAVSFIFKRSKLSNDYMDRTGRASLHKGLMPTNVVDGEPRLRLHGCATETSGPSHASDVFAVALASHSHSERCKGKQQSARTYRRTLPGHLGVCLGGHLGGVTRLLAQQ
jgi:hypothetical protein